MYAPWFACTDCARGIILAGIREVVGLVSLRQATPRRWLENLEMADEMLSRGGVNTRWLNETVGVTIRFDGRDFSC
jgi:deoxycytidylate deaminase